MLCRLEHKKFYNLEAWVENNMTEVKFIQKRKQTHNKYNMKPISYIWNNFRNIIWLKLLHSYTH